ncbi:hypothetical protein E3V33_04220 [Candidatus Marinimicrobia bacterium MT.SAG.4]|nr:hypothetical protein E3V33_04220 [Candidatus Marinimicrobia bacterium MT.SAG.4]
MILIMISLISTSLFAQTGSGRSKAQKESLKEQIKSSGKSDVEIKEQLKQSGMSDAEIQSQIDNLQDSDKQPVDFDKDIVQTKTEAVPESAGDILDEAKIEYDELSQFDEFEELDEEELPIFGEAPIAEGVLRPFGYEIFNLSPKTFEPLEGGPVDPNYPLGPGDEIVLTLWGDTEQFHRLRIDREGKILIPDIGQVVISGLTLERAEEKIKSRLSGVYSGLGPISGSQSTFFDLSMGKLRSIRIFIMGEVKRPGGYTMRATVTAFNALYYGGGPNQRGSLRNIRIIRDGKTINRMDLYSYLLYGKTEEDMRLQDGDAIFVPIRGRMVAIKGEINAPAFYELKPWDKLRNLLSLARGLKATAYVNRIQIDRIVPFEERESYPHERKIIDIDYKSYMKDKDKDFQLVDGDVISVFSIMDVKMNLVNIAGSVTRPGTYELNEEMRLTDLIDEADGVLGEIYLDRADIIRTKTDLTKQLIQIDLGLAMSGDSTQNLLLQKLDEIRIYSIHEIEGSYSVTIKGHVKRPGRYPLLEDMNLYDLLFKAGGMLDHAYMKNTYLERADIIRIGVNSLKRDLITFDLGKLLEGDNSENLNLQNKDEVIIYSMNSIEGLSSVTISGHVKRAGRYKYQDNMTIYDLLFKAGGMLDPAYMKNTYLERADIIRIGENSLKRDLITFNLGKLLEGDNSENLILKNRDEIIIYSMNSIEGQSSVSISGHVKRPGKYKFQDNMTIYDLLFKAGGMLDPAYMKNTYLKRADIIRIGDTALKRNIISFNLGKVLDGDPGENLILRNQDEVIVYSMESIEDKPTVTISGHVLRPDKYRFQDNMTIYDLLFKAGGMLDEDYRKETYLERADLLRLNEDGITRRTIPIHLGKVLLKDPKENMQLIDKDELIVYDIFTVERRKYVTIDGKVKRPGQFELTEGMSIKDLVLRAGGYTDDAFRFQAEVARIDPWKIDGNSLADIIDVNLPTTLAENNVNEEIFLLEEYDRVSIKRHPYWQVQRTVSILGEVKFPGKYSLKDKNEKLSDLVERAGGMSSEAFEEGARFARGGQRVIFDLKKALNSNSTKDDIVLRPGDNITIPKHPMVVALSGAVQTPGLLKYIQGKKAGYYIDRVGGFQKEADRGNVLIARANGRVDSATRRYWWDPKVNDGDQIRVAFKEKKDPFDLSGFLKDSASIAASFATVIFIISQSSK